MGGRLVRVIAGVARGTPLRAPKGLDVRPTADRVKEAMFSALDAVDAIEGRRVLDLYAGSGALGIEALSRGAAHATFVERDRHAAAAIQRNLTSTGLAGTARLLRADVGAAALDEPFDLVLCDPPYAESVTAVYGVLARVPLAPAAIVVVERDRRAADLDTSPPGVLAFDRTRTYGDTVLLFLRAQELH